MLGKKYYLRDDPEFGFTRSQVKKFGKAKQLDVMETWFRTYFENPAQETPYESAEGGYQFIWGGPYDADEQLQDEFSDIVPLERIQELSDKLSGEGWQWAPTHLHPDREGEGQDQELDEPPPDIALDEIVQALKTGTTAKFGDGYERTLRVEIQNRLEALESAVKKLASTSPGMGHNHPPGPLDAEDMSLSGQTKHELLTAAEEVRAQLSRPDPDALSIAHSSKAMLAIGNWLTSKLDKAVDKAIDVAVPVGMAVASTHLNELAGLILSAVQLAIDWLTTVTFPF